MEVTPELLEKYGKGLCSASEVRFIERWMDKNEGFDHISVEANLENPKTLENRLWKRIRLSKTSIPRNAKKNPFSKSVRGIAAVLLVLLALGIFLALNHPGKVYRTGPGEMKTIVLEDGTKILLNAGSFMEVQRNFGASERKVTFHGEGYFDVATDTLHPFIINTKLSRTKVLGTKFNLSSFGQEVNTLTLDEGSVEFAPNGNASNTKLILVQGEQATLENGTLRKKTIKSENHKAWTNKVLVFQDTPFKETIAEIERFYGIKVTVEKTSLYKKKYNGYHTNPSIKSLLEDVGFVLGFEHQKEGNQIRIY